MKEGCFKYLEESSKDLLTHKIIFSIAKLSSEKMGPVKIAEISKDVFGEDEKSKKDLIRLGIEKSLSKCGMVEKLQYASNDVRYLLTAYRFQKVREIESFSGDRVESFDKFEIPKSLWPIPDEYYKLLSKKFGYDEALKKINADFDHGVIPRGEYEDLIREYSQNLTQIQNKINSKFNGLEDSVN
ncbi:MAG: hypothetical protein IIA82_03825 [Thaumarchaeota archaeon]|nr:hypothetical protein [Nitrososphaerota archaeon]